MYTSLGGDALDLHAQSRGASFDSSHHIRSASRRVPKSRRVPPNALDLDAESRGKDLPTIRSLIDNLKQGLEDAGTVHGWMDAAAKLRYAAALGRLQPSERAAPGARPVADPAAADGVAHPDACATRGAPPPLRSKVRRPWPASPDARASGTLRRADPRAARR